MDEKPDSKRGFARLSPEQLRKLSAKGGKNVPKEKRAFALNHDLARSAATIGGSNVPPEKRAFSQDRALAQAAGKRGGATRKADASKS